METHSPPGGGLKEEEEKESESCPICKEAPGLQAIVMPCKHEFDLECIRMWIESGRAAATTCPLCRGVVTAVRYTPDGEEGVVVEDVVVDDGWEGEEEDEEDGSMSGYEDDSEGEEDGFDVHDREEIHVPGEGDGDLGDLALGEDRFRDDSGGNSEGVRVDGGTTDGLSSNQFTEVEQEESEVDPRAGDATNVQPLTHPSYSDILVEAQVRFEDEDMDSE